VKANIDQGFQIFPICFVDMVHLDHGVPALVDLPLCATLRPTVRWVRQETRMQRRPNINSFSA
jgi:hypothetical protein